MPGPESQRRPRRRRWSPAPLSDAESAAIYAAVVRHLFAGEDSSGRRHRPAVVYLLQWTDERAGDTRKTAAERAPIPETVQGRGE